MAGFKQSSSSMTHPHARLCGDLLKVETEIKDFRKLTGMAVVRANNPSAHHKHQSMSGC